MRRRQRSSEGWVPVGRLDPRGGGLPARHARRLLLEHAWRTVAGERVSRRAPALGIRRGVLEIEVPEEPWAEVLRPLVPRLAGRLAGRFPELGVRRLRLVRGDGKPVAGSAPVKPETLPRSRPAASPEPDRPAPPEPLPGNDSRLPHRLARVAERYLRARCRRDPR